MQNPAPGGAPLVELEPPRLLQHVDHRVGIAAHREVAARGFERAQRTDAIAEVSFRCGAGADRDLVFAEQADVALVEMNRVHSCQVGTEDALALQ